jgi:hypothetical protein
MGKPKRIWQALAAIFLIIGLGSLLTPFYAEICEKDIYTGNKECSAHHVAVSLILYIGQFLEAHAGAITGVATAILAIITWRIVSLGKDQSETTRKQLRAYLSIVIGQATYQDDARNIRFEAKPLLINNGETPAYNVRVRIKADILTDSVSKNFTFLPRLTPLKVNPVLGRKKIGLCPPFWTT